MNTTELVHYVTTGRRSRPCPAPGPKPPYSSELIAPVRVAMICARQRLLSSQRRDGSWLGRMACDASLASQLVFWLTYVGKEHSPLAERAAASILSQQLPNGGWPLAPGGAAEVSISVQAYFALKLAGISPCDKRMGRARATIRRLGGADAADAETRYFLALFGQVDYNLCPPILPESLLLDRLARGPAASVAIVWSHRTVRDVGIDRSVRELFVRHPSVWSATAPNTWPRSDRCPPRWAGLAKLAQSALSMLATCCERLGWTPMRLLALQRAETLALHDAGRESHAPFAWREWVWLAIALRAVGFNEECCELRAREERLHELMQTDDAIEREARTQHGMEWSDTHLAVQALCASGLTHESSCAVGARRWSLQHVRSREFFSAVQLAEALQSLGEVLLPQRGLSTTPLPDIRMSRHGERCPAKRTARVSPSWHRLAAVVARRLLDQQNPDGGWSATGGTRSTPDATGRVLEAFASLPASEKQCIEWGIKRGVQFLKATQRADGSWDSTSGVQFVHGTALAVRGLLLAGVPNDDAAVGAGINWLVVHQHENGGWGESAAGATDAPRHDYTTGAATAIQTAWAIRALVAAGRANDAAVLRGIDFLLQTQEEDGGWQEAMFVLRDEQSGRWFHNELHATAEPLLALATWSTAAMKEYAEQPSRFPLRLASVFGDD